MDTINGGEGDDTLNGGEGDDIINGNAGNDTVNGNEGDDTLNGNEGDDTLSGGAGADVINGGAGADVIDGGAGADDVDGGAGDDIVYLDADDASPEGGADNDTASYERYQLEDADATEATITLASGGTFENFVGSQYSDTLNITGPRSVDITVNGGPGDDDITIANASSVGNVTFVVKAGEGDDSIKSEYGAADKLEFQGFPEGTTATVEHVSNSSIVRVGGQTVRVDDRASGLTESAFEATITVK